MKEHSILYGDKHDENDYDDEKNMFIESEWEDEELWYPNFHMRLIR